MLIVELMNTPTRMMEITLLNNPSLSQMVIGGQIDLSVGIKFR